MPANTQKVALRASVIISLLLFAGLWQCTAKTTLSAVWQDKAYEPGQIERILVIGVSKDSLIRKAIEYYIADELSGKDIIAIPSIKRMSAREKQNIENFKRVFYEGDFDGALAVRYLGTDERSTEAFNLNYTPNNAYNGFYGYYNMIYDMSFSSRYTIRERYVRVEANLYDTLDERLIWSGIVETKNPKKLSEIVKPMSAIIASQLVDSDFFVRQ